MYRYDDVHPNEEKNGEDPPESVEYQELCEEDAAVAESHHQENQGQEYEPQPQEPVTDEAAEGQMLQENFQEEDDVGDNPATTDPTAVTSSSAETAAASTPRSLKERISQSMCKVFLYFTLSVAIYILFSFFLT